MLTSIFTDISDSWKTLGNTTTKIQRGKYFSKSKYCFQKQTLCCPEGRGKLTQEEIVGNLRRVAEERPTVRAVLLLRRKDAKGVWWAAKIKFRLPENFLPEGTPEPLTVHSPPPPGTYYMKSLCAKLLTHIFSFNPLPNPVRKHQLLT